VSHIPSGAWAILILVVVASFLFGARRYRGTRETGDAFRATPEVFRDPTTGRWTRVYEDPATGKRQYRPTDNPADKGSA